MSGWRGSVAGMHNLPFDGARDLLARAEQQSGLGGSGVSDESRMGGSGFGDEGSGYAIAVAALRFFMVKATTNRVIAFDLDEAHAALADGVQLAVVAEAGNVLANGFGCRDQFLTGGHVVADSVDGDGSVQDRDFFNQVIGIDIEKAGPVLQQTGIKFWNQFELPPGSYVARTLVRNANSSSKSSLS